MTDKIARIIKTCIFTLTIIFAPMVPGAQNMKHVEITTGRIIKIDKFGSRVKIAHGEIKQFEMAPMTMYFGVTGLIDLTAFQENDQIQFELKRGRDKNLRIMAMCTLEQEQDACLN